MVLPVISLEIVLEGFKFEKYVRLVRNSCASASVYKSNVTPCVFRDSIC